MENMLDFLNPQDLFFYISDGGLLCLQYKGEDIGRVAVIRAFPFQTKDEYIVIRKENYSRLDSENEIGILKSLDSLSDEQANLVKKDLEKRYFMPEISDIINIKEEYGNISFVAETNAGKREFTITDMSANIRKLNERNVMLTDIYGNRYFIPDISKLNDKSMKILEIWI